jgi:uncharacterized protein involved in exopolysaccharide biosynthesis
MEQNEVELIDYLKVVWKRKGLIVGGTLVAAAAVLVVGLATPKTYEVSRTIQIGKLPGRIHEGKTIGVKLVESREAVIGRLTDHRVMEMVMEKVHSGLPNTEIGVDDVSISTKRNPNVKYIVQTHDPQAVVRIADELAEHVIKSHKSLFDRGLQITKEHEAELAATIQNIEVEIQSMKKIMKRIMEDPEIDAPAVILLQANIEDRERSLADFRRELKVSRLSRLGSENTSVISADAPPKHPIKPRVKLNVALAGTLGLMMFTFIAFFVEYLANVKRA